MQPFGTSASVRVRLGQVDGDVMVSSYVRSDSSPSVSWKVGSFQAFVEAKVRPVFGMNAIVAASLQVCRLDCIPSVYMCYLYACLLWHR